MNIPEKKESPGEVSKMTQSFDEHSRKLTLTQRLHYPRKLWPLLRAGWVPIYAETAVNITKPQAVLSLDGVTQVFKL